MIRKVRMVFIITACCAVLIGIGIGIAIGATKNIQKFENIGEYKPAVPSQILDIKDRLITEFFSDEKREIVSIEELPRHLIYALITREDQDFFNHHGFSLRGTLRAGLNLILGRYFSGGSTITQQIAGHLYANRAEISFTRKLKELWWALQLERSLTKYEILELYLNKMYFGSGVYGVEAASRFYFNHSARDLTLAESVALVIQLANPVRYNPIRYPNRLKKIQYEVLQQMVRLGYATQEDADQSFEEYWSNYDYTRSSSSTAFLEREDKAPYFSEYVRQELNELLYGSLDIYKDGFIVHTTLNLDFQQRADQLMREGITKANADYQASSSNRMVFAEEKFIPIVDLISLAFNIEDIRVAGTKSRQKSLDFYQKKINPVLDVASMLMGADDLKFAARIGYSKALKSAKKNTVEGALVTLENSTGYILAMVGGSRFESINQFNRAVQAKVQPGSAFKPLYYAAAVERKKITPATMLYDGPVVFWNDDGTPYTPMNYKGEWQGPVLARTALAKSMNVPSLKILDAVGFDAAIQTAAALLGIEDPNEIERTFPRKYPLGLGIISISPIQMARAFATLANQGKEVVPLAIRYIEDRSGKIILEPEKEVRNAQRKKGKAAQIVSPQTAYIMTDIMKSTVEYGTLAYAKNTVDGFPMPMAGKTGTTQNWSDIWTVGYSPYYTTAIWFGFDQPGNSLGINQTGATVPGPIWARFMKDIHTNLPPKDFPRPDGIVTMTVTARSGLIPPPGYTGKTIQEIFIAGTEPKKFDDFHEFETERNQITLDRLRNAILPQEVPLEEALPNVGLQIDPRILTGSSSTPKGHFPPSGSTPPVQPSSGKKESRNPLLD